MVINKIPMGWNSWNTFGASIDEELIIKTGELMVKLGLRDVGYEYVVIDDCWALKERDKNGRLVADPKKFPHGMKYLSDKLHEMGLKFGMYSCAGLLTCAGYPSSYGHEWVDAASFAEWGVDYLKYDFCFKPHNRIGAELYRNMGMALANCGRDILFSACSWGTENTHEWIRTTGANIWRSTGDIHDNWKSIVSLTLQQLNKFAYGGMNCYNDMDMLVVGMKGKGNVGFGGCTDKEYETHFALWCLLQSPLMIGCDIRTVDDETLKILKNERLIEIACDRAASQPYRLPSRSPVDIANNLILVRQLSNGDIAIGLFNLDDTAHDLACMFSNVGIEINSGKTLELTDCVTGEVTRPKNDVIAVRLNPHESVVYRARVIDKE